MAATYDGNITTDGCPDSIPGVPLCIPSNLSSPPPPPLTFTTHIPLKSHLVPNLIIAAAALLAASFLLLLATYAVHRVRRRRRLLLSVTPSAAPDHVAGDGVEADVDAAEAVVDHHVWHIRTAGLDDTTIRSIPTAVYSSKKGLGGAADCAVCLADLRDGELLRLLPKCSHAFHLPCIDTWLRSHLNCPLCRSPILAPPADAVPVPAIAADSDNSASPTPTLTAQIDVAPPPAVASSSSPVEDGLQPVRRSVSMDAASLAALLLRAVPEDNYCGEEREVVNRENQLSAAAAAAVALAKGAGVQKGAQRMGRSLSSRSGRFFFSRYARGRNSVLPF